MFCIQNKSTWFSVARYEPWRYENKSFQVQTLHLLYLMVDVPKKTLQAYTCANAKWFGISTECDPLYTISGHDVLVVILMASLHAVYGCRRALWDSSGAGRSGRPRQISRQGPLAWRATSFTVGLLTAKRCKYISIQKKIMKRMSLPNHCSPHCCSVYFDWRLIMCFQCVNVSNTKHGDHTVVVSRSWPFYRSTGFTSSDIDKKSKQ